MLSPKQGDNAGRCWTALQVRAMTAILPRWRFNRYRRWADSLASEAKTLYDIPQNITEDMMKEMLFTVGGFDQQTHITLGYVTPEFAPYYNSALMEHFKNHPTISWLGFAINFEVNDSVHPLTSDDSFLLYF